MKSLKELLNDAEKRFIELNKRLERFKDSELKGYLGFNKRKNSIQYYHCYKADGKRIRKYIPEDKKFICRALARKSYLANLKNTVKKLLKHIIALNKIYEDDIVEKIYTRLPDERKSLFSPIEPTSKQVQALWMSESFLSNPFPKDENFFIITNNKEQVRSKSEKILADYFQSQNISYKYEKLLLLEGKEIYPDFTFLHPVTREEIYWEHFGIMDYEEYSSQAYEKICLYERNGLMLGDRLIVTFESSNKNIDYNLLDKKIDLYLR